MEECSAVGQMERMAVARRDKPLPSRPVARETIQDRVYRQLVAMIVDGEFQMHRDPVEAPCGPEGAKRIADWSLGHELESRWVAAR